MGSTSSSPDTTSPTSSAPTSIDQPTPPQQNPLECLDQVPPSPPSNSTIQQKPEPDLPKLSAADFRTYNKLATMMDAYHNHFRHTWTMLYRACSTNSRPHGMSIRQFISQALHLCHALTVHHTIEEQYIFPELGERMDCFKVEGGEMIKQHELIHEGLEALEGYLRAVQGGEREMRMEEMKSVMDSFGGVLWEHLDAEVRNLGAENMRRFWSKREIQGMNW